jgi:hypothetical protein
MSDSKRRRRQRAPRACHPCRQMKRKCDGQKPCSTCVRYQHDCQYQGLESKSLNNPVSTNDVSRKTVNNSYAPEAAARGLRDNEKPDRSILDPERGRFFDSSSAIAFPRLLGFQLGANKAPRLHSFAWNLGLRSEPLPNVLDITGLVSLDDVHFYSRQYFKKVNPTFDFLDEHKFLHRAGLRWQGSANEEALDYDAVICSVVSLGYLCSQRTENDTEAALIAFAKNRLESVGLSRPPTVDLISAWILRAIYLRATSRPQASWMASNIVLHLAEASGIYRELSSISIIYPPPESSNIDHAQIMYRRKVFWIGRALNTIFSYEYSRPRIAINNIDSALVDSIVCESTRDLLRLADLIPQSSQGCSDESEVLSTKALLGSINSFNKCGSPISLFAADIAFAAYRHLRPFINPATSNIDPTISQILSIGSAALNTIQGHVRDPPTRSHFTQGQCITPWWSLISVPFHFILILLSIDTQECLSQVPHALRTLQQVALTFDTHLVREAAQTASMLIRLSQVRKEANIKLLRAALTDADESAARARSIRNAEPPLTLESGPAITGQQLQQDPACNNTTISNSSGVLDGNEFTNGNFAGLGFSNDQLLSENLLLDWNDVFNNLNWI